jgi:RNA polymerase sigma factor (sigma-70 family)
MTTVPTARPAAVRPPAATAWRERSARLYEELKRPSRALVRRAFRGAFTDDEVDDIYSSAWVGTLHALERRHQALEDEEVRKYVLTAVAHHASKEIRRRKRRPVAPLDGVHALPDDGLLPDETAAKREQSRVARDVLSSLPPRRRAVMLLRYGWGLEPRQVCELVKGLSPRAYRKEITRGIDELAAKLRRVERGEWCSDREPLLKAYASGLADEEQRRQAQQHLSHCRHCSDFVGKLSGHLHDIGSAAAIPTTADAIGEGRVSLLNHGVDLVRRAKESALSAFGRNAGDGVQETSAQAISVSGSARGAGAAGTGALAKLAGAGTAGKAHGYVPRRRRSSDGLPGDRRRANPSSRPGKRGRDEDRDGDREAKAHRASGASPEGAVGCAVPECGHRSSAAETGSAPANHDDNDGRCSATNRHDPARPDHHDDAISNRAEHPAPGAGVRRRLSGDHI